MLTSFRKAQQSSIARLAALESTGALPAPYAGARLPFAAGLKKRGPGAVIAEYKRASPSLGDINLGLEPEEVASLYARAGASAFSVLTEGAHFKGDVDFLARMAGPGLPMLRKDFLLHPLQVEETAATPASALLLIVRMHDAAALVAMLNAAKRFGLEAVIEVFSRDDLNKARQALAESETVAGGLPAIIQVNNRDLDTLILSETPSRELITLKRDEEIWISASGVTRRDQVIERARLGFDAVLVGSSIMRERDPGEALARLTGTAWVEKGQ